MTNYSISIGGFDNPVQFVQDWSKQYTYTLENKYNDHINNCLNNQESFIELFKWKNGTGDRISNDKMKVVMGFWGKVEILRKLRTDFNWGLFEKEFEPHKNSTIWKIFLLHLVDVNQFPIFDQHVFRTYNFLKKGKIEELPISSEKVYEIYKYGYLMWFPEIQTKYNLHPKKMDESFFSFGRMLKGLKDFPIKIKH